MLFVKKQGSFGIFVNIFASIGNGRNPGGNVAELYIC
jgi:hypothetical protein